jgi:neuroligin
MFQELNSQHLDPVEVFRGIPYAAPPVGDLRFRVPEPPLAWKSMKRADTFGQVCPQKLPHLRNQTIALQDMPQGRYNQLVRFIKFLSNQSEDCLFLNLYIPGSGELVLPALLQLLCYVSRTLFSLLN